VRAALDVPLQLLVGDDLRTIGKDQVQKAMARNMQHRTHRNTEPVLSVTALIRDRVTNREGEELGTIKDLMLDVHSGRVAYAVLSFGGVLGMGDKLYAIPWSALTLDQSSNAFTLDASREMLRHAPGFDKDKWPDMSDPGFGTDIYSFYGARPYWE
jgi:sporulation protein YlmC with PRC-barrel domain